MKRIFLLMVVLFSLHTVQGQLYTGGKGDGATMSCVPPKVTTLSETEIICVGDTITMAIYATGSNLQYFWQKFQDNFYVDLQADNRYVGLGTPVLQIVNPEKEQDDGLYRCLVKNSCDSDTSEIFVIKLNTVPKVDSRISNSEAMEYICANQFQSIDLITSISSAENDHRYTWAKIDTISGVRTLLPDTTANLTVNVSGAALDAEGLYVVTAANGCGSVSDSVILPIIRKPEVIWQNTVDNVIATCVGEQLKLSAIIKGEANTIILQSIVYDDLQDEWWVQSNSYLAFPSKSYYSVNKSMEGYYRWKVENKCGEVLSANVFLSVEGRPSFLTPAAEVYQFPQDTTICEGSDIKLWCKASGSATRYYWQKDGVRIDGADTNVLVLKNVTVEDEATYVCVAYNSCMSSVKSKPIKVKLQLRPRFLRDPYLLRNACLGDTLTRFRVAMDIEPAVDSVRWMYNGKLVYDNGHYEHTDDTELYLHHISHADVGLYQVRAYNECGPTDSKWVNLLELGMPVSFQNRLEDYKMTLCPGIEQKLSLSVNGSAPIHYKWIVNEHTYDTDTNFVTIKGNDIVEKNKYSVFAYNACGSAIDSGFLNVEQFEHFDFVGEGEYCEGTDPVSRLVLKGSDTSKVYTLYREYETAVETFRGTGDSIVFENQPGGTYYVIARNPKTECVQEMNGRPVVDEKPAPNKANFFIASYYCLGSGGAKLVLAKWEKDVIYQLQYNTGNGWTDLPDQRFIGGKYDFPLASMNSPVEGEPKVYSNMGAGAYRIVAERYLGNGCQSILTLEDSIEVIAPPSLHKLYAVNGDTVNCNREVNGQPYEEKAQLEVDRFLKGATYTLYKNGAPDPDHQPDRTSPIGWSLIDEGTYYVEVETREGCKGTTNEVRIHNVKAPDYITLSGSGSLCADEDTETDHKTLTLDTTQLGITYYVYRKEPAKLIDVVDGTGTPKDVIVPAQRATYYVKAVDATGMCATTSEAEYTMLASNYQVSMNPADIFLDGKGLTTWLHADITGAYVEPLDVQWHDEKQLQQTGLVTLPNVQYYKHYHWPFCPCAAYHTSYGDTWVHQYVHGPQCNMTNCPYLYHNYNPTKNGCTYVGTEYQTYTNYGYGKRGPWYDLYYCKDGVGTDKEEHFYQNDTTNPFRNRLTTPVNEDRIYTVTVTDGAGCTHSDQVAVRVLGGKLRAEIISSEVHKHYAYPFCPCYAQHSYPHYCSSRCNENNCVRLYHAHKHENCTYQRTEYIEYRGSYVKYYDLYYCCSSNEAQDTAVYRKDELFFCSDARGGDYNYVKKWSFYCPEDNAASWTGKLGDTVKFTALESGWLYLQVTSMGQEVRDSIWIDVLRRPFTAYVQDADENRIDTLYVCKGEEARLYGYTAGGDDDNTVMQWWGEGYTGPSTHWWIFKPERSGNIIFTAMNDGVVIKDTVFLNLQDRPDLPVVKNPGVRCVQPNVTELIRVEAPTVVGVNYILEYSNDNGENFVEYDRENNSAGGPIEFRVTMPVRDAGIYRVRAVGKISDHGCESLSELIEFITPPAHDALVSNSYCDGELMTVQLQQPTAGMSYSILSNRNINFETIDAPRDYFQKPLMAGDYKIVYTRKGFNGVCSDTLPMIIEKVPSAQLVDVIVNNGAGACEGMNAVLTIPNSESGITYYLESPTGERTEMFVGNGGSQSFDMSGRSYGTYQVKGEFGGCSTLIDYFTFNRNPEALDQPDVKYCYAYGMDKTSAGTELKYTTLEPDVTYYLWHDGVLEQTITGPGAGTFTNVTDGNYSIMAKNDESSCFAETSFKVIAQEAPYAFSFKMSCEKNKVLYLESSQENVEYYLYRDTLLLDSLMGTGAKLEFGEHNITGVYQVIGIDTLTGCSEKMNGDLIVNELGKCSLEQTDPLCGMMDATELVYPCSKKGWSYYIKDITDPYNPLVSETKDGNGATLRWSSMGTTTNLFRPHWLNPFQWIPSEYVLYGKDICGDVALDTIRISLGEKPSGVLEVEGHSATSNFMSIVQMSSCENQDMEFFASNIKEGMECTFIGVKSMYYRDTLRQFVATSENINKQSLGIFRGYKEYQLHISSGDCETVLTVEMVFKVMPQPGLLNGQSVCQNEGTLDISLKSNDGYNYYLMREGLETPLDTILWDNLANLGFASQTEAGRYYVIVENVEPSANGKFTAICRDTMLSTFAIGDAPKVFHVSSALDGKQEIYLCDGNMEKIKLAGSEPTVDYILCRDGDDNLYGEWQHRSEGGFLEFPVKESGKYKIKGVLGSCEQIMDDSVIVYADQIPDLKLYDEYYYCRDEEGGAKIEIFEAPVLCKADLRDAGMYGKILESDTVHYWGDTLDFKTKCPAGDHYVLTITTRGGCRFSHPFKVYKVDPPKQFELLATSSAICEEECMSIGVAGDEPRVEYALMRVTDEGPVQHDENYILGYGDRDTLWFPYRVCDVGKYFVVATQYDRPHCSTLMKFAPDDTLVLNDIDTIRYCDFTEHELHYCVGGTGVSITLENAQLGVDYELYKGEENLATTFTDLRKVATYDGENLTWTELLADTACSKDGIDRYTTYRILARSQMSGCTKWMKGEVKVYADGEVDLTAVTQPYYEFCEGGDLLLKARAAGCGLKYVWKMSNNNGIQIVGNEPDLYLSSLPATNSGSYYCEIANACEMKPTSPYIQVNVRPEGNMTPVGAQSLCESERAILYSQMTDVYDYAWYKVGQDSILSRNSFLEFDSVTMDMAGVYGCVGGSLSKNACNILYDTIKVTVLRNIGNANIVQRYDTVCAGSPLTLNLSDQLPEGYKVQWYLNGQIIPKATKYNFSRIPMYTSHEGVYAVQLSNNGCGKQDLIPVSKVKVDTLINYVWHTEDKYLCQPHDIPLSVRTSPMDGVTFDWYQIISGSGEQYIGSGSDFNAPFPKEAGHVTYRVYYYNSCPADYYTTLNHQDVEVNIATNVAFVKNLPDEISGCEGERADTTVTVEISGTLVSDYVWTFTPASTARVDTVAMGSSDFSYTIPYDKEHSGLYTCTANTSCGRLVSNACWVRVNTPVVITEDLTPASGKMCEGSYYSPKLTATGSDLQFRWFITYPDGSVDTVRRGMGYDWEATDQLSLLTDVKYDGAQLQCVVRNNCGEALSTPVTLSIVAPREINVTPPETWLCCDSTARVEVELLNGDGGAWSYKLQRNDLNPTSYSVDAGYIKDTVDGLLSGSYAVTDLYDGICDYKDKVMKEFNIYDVPRGVVHFGLASGGRDTMICAGEKVPMYIKITEGTGPYRVAVYYQDNTMTEPAIYNKWFDTNPFNLSTSEAMKGYYFDMTVADNVELTVVVTDRANNKIAEGCTIPVEADQKINVKSTAKLSVNWGGWSQNIGECELDVDLRALLNPTPANGIFHISKLAPGKTDPIETFDRTWAYAHILKSDGPGTYEIRYSLGGVCDESTNTALTLTVDSLPYAVITPSDTTLCCGAGLKLYASMRGAVPFDSLLIRTERLLDDHTTTSGSQMYTLADHTPLTNPQWVTYSMNSNCSDSISRYVAVDVVDGHGCHMNPALQNEALVRVHKLPTVTVEGMHPSYNNGMWDAYTSLYSLNTDDSVRVKVTMNGFTPWVLNLAYREDASSAAADSVDTYTVYAHDTTLMLKKEGVFHFVCNEVNGCAPMGGAVMRTVKYAPSGYIKIRHLYLGGALANLAGTTPAYYHMPTMSSNLAYLPDFPQYADAVRFPAFAANFTIRKSQIVDWIFVEARKLDVATSSWSVVDRDTCLLLNDGSVVNRNFNNNIELKGTGVVGEKFYVAVFHRNHLPVMTNQPSLFSTTGIGTPIDFGLSANNYYVRGGVLSDHVWDFWTVNGQTLWVMAPSYQQINKTDKLVSLSNSTKAFFVNLMTMVPGYHIWDVTFDGQVTVPPVAGSPAGYEDAWILFLNRDRYSEIEEY